MARGKFKGNGKKPELVGYVNLVIGLDVQEKYADDYSWFEWPEGRKSQSYRVAYINRYENDYGGYVRENASTTESGDGQVSPLDAWDFLFRAKSDDNMCNVSIRHKMLDSNGGGGRRGGSRGGRNFDPLSE